MQACNSVPSAAYLLSTCGGICCTSTTLPGQLMTRLAVEPPTMLLCLIVGLNFDEGKVFVVTVATFRHSIERVAKLGLRPLQQDFLGFVHRNFKFHLTVLELIEASL
jgi:hypothetical protein